MKTHRLAPFLSTTRYRPPPSKWGEEWFPSAPSSPLACSVVLPCVSLSLPREAGVRIPHRLTYLAPQHSPQQMTRVSAHGQGRSWTCGEKPSLSQSASWTAAAASDVNSSDTPSATDLLRNRHQRLTGTSPDANRRIRPACCCKLRDGYASKKHNRPNTVTVGGVLKSTYTYNGLSEDQQTVKSAFEPALYHGLLKRAPALSANRMLDTVSRHLYWLWLVILLLNLIS